MIGTKAMDDVRVELKAVTPEMIEAGADAYHDAMAVEAARVEAMGREFRGAAPIRWLEAVYRAMFDAAPQPPVSDDARGRARLVSQWLDNLQITKASPICGDYFSPDAIDIIEDAVRPLLQALTLPAQGDGRDATIEECAKVAEAHMSNGKRMFGHNSQYDNASTDIATAIRALRSTRGGSDGEE